MSDGAARRFPWLAACAIGALAVAGTLRTGVSLTPDGIAYLDLSDAALHGRWHEFLNAYWSPLFPLLLALARRVVGESADREPLAVALVNGVAAAVVLRAFAAVLRALAHRGALPSVGARARLMELVSWSAVAAVLLRIVPIALSTPDLLVVAAQLTAVALMLGIGSSGHYGRTALAAGVALGVGFLAKGAVLVLSASYLIVVVLLVPRALRVRATALLAVGIAIVAVPWVIALSGKEGRITIGSVGRLNLAWYVGRQSSQVPDPDAADTESLTHPWPRLTNSPVVYDYASHAVGTYPPWSDPTWWNEGLEPRPTLRNLWQVALDSGVTVWSLLGLSILGWCVSIALLGRSAPAPLARDAAALGLLALAQLGAYWPVHVEVRFLGIAWILAWLAMMVLHASRPPGHRIAPAVVTALAAAFLYAIARPAFGSPRELAVAAALSLTLLVAVARAGWRTDRRTLGVAVVLLTATTAPWMAGTFKVMAAGADPERLRAAAIARTLRDLGIADGVAVASVNASAPADWARLGRWRIVAEVATSQAPQFWRIADTDRQRIVGALVDRRIHAIVGTLDNAASAPTGWTRVPGSNAVVLPLTARAK